MKTGFDNPVSTRRLKVLQLGKFYPPQRGGMESHLKTLCDALREDIDLEVIVSNTAPRTFRESCDGIPVTRISQVGQVASTSVNPALAAEIRRRKVDLIHLHWPNPMAALGWLMSRQTASLVITYHSDVVKQRTLSNIFSPVLRAALQRSKAIFVSSEQYLETSAVLRDYRDRCRVAPFGIAETYFAARNEKAVADIRAQFGEGLILAAGRLVEYKGFEYLIRAMAETRGRLLIAGGGPLRKELESLSRSLGLTGRVTFVGEPSDDGLRSLYHAADIFVLASTNRREAFGLVQAEAMSAAKPVINTHIDSGVPFVSLDGVTGLTVPHSDAGSLARAMNRLLEDAPLRLKLGTAARRRAEAMFRAETMAARTLQVYRSVLRMAPQIRESVGKAARQAG